MTTMPARRLVAGTQSSLRSWNVPGKELKIADQNVRGEARCLTPQSRWPFRGLSSGHRRRQRVRDPRERRTVLVSVAGRSSRMPLAGYCLVVIGCASVAETPSLSAIRTRSTNDLAPILCITWLRWTLTVISLNLSS
jgi:hypothetical protein